MAAPRDKAVDGKRAKDPKRNIEECHEEHAGIFVHMGILSYFLHLRQALWDTIAV